MQISVTGKRLCFVFLCIILYNITISLTLLFVNRFFTKKIFVDFKRLFVFWRYIMQFSFVHYIVHFVSVCYYILFVLPFHFLITVFRDNQGKSRYSRPFPHPHSDIYDPGLSQI